MNSNIVELLEVLGLDADGDPAGGGIGVEGAVVGVTGGLGIQCSKVGCTSVGFLRKDDIMRHELQEAAHLGNSNTPRAEEGHEEASGIPRAERQGARRP